MSVDVGGKKQNLEVEKVLVAAGRAPNIDDIGIKEAGVQLTDRGFIKINERMETSAKGIYAIGDVAGPPMLAHKGQREGVVFAEFLAGEKHVHAVNYGNIPKRRLSSRSCLDVMTECGEDQKSIQVGNFFFRQRTRRWQARMKVSSRSPRREVREISARHHWQRTPRTDPRLAGAREMSSPSTRWIGVNAHPPSPKPSPRHLDSSARFWRVIR